MGIASKNMLLNRLSDEDRGLLDPGLMPVELKLRHDLSHPHTPIEHVYFLDAGLGSVVAVSASGEHLEVGVIGSEGMSGTSVVMGDSQSPHQCYMQVAGSGQRIRSDDLRAAMRQSPSLHGVLMRYVHAFMIQAQHTALANGRRKLEERLARWLLMCHDRIKAEEIPITHEFLALMLGVRRTGVTLALHLLEGHGMIRSRRGRVRIMDREALIETAAGSYGVPEAEYRRLMS